MKRPPSYQLGLRRFGNRDGLARFCKRRELESMRKAMLPRWRRRLLILKGSRREPQPSPMAAPARGGPTQ